jgi:acetolactate decarboxylase
VARDIIDDTLIGALHLRVLSLAGLDHDPAIEHAALQAGTLDALMAGGYDGDATLAQLLAHGDTGIGTVQHLDGELVVLDGEPWAARADGRIEAVDPTTCTPFAVVCHFAPTVEATLPDGLPLGELHRALDRLAPSGAPVVAVRVDGEFTQLTLRSVHPQTPPYPPLREVVGRQTEWTVARSTGTVVGFRFPDTTAGVEVPGYHLHYLSRDRTIGGHVLALTLEAGRVAIDPCDELHVELPEHVQLGVPGAADRDEISRLEGGG